MTSIQLADLPKIDRLRYQLNDLTLSSHVTNKTLDEIRRIQAQISELEDLESESASLPE
jgi:hypothetical protein